MAGADKSASGTDGMPAASADAASTTPSSTNGASSPADARAKVLGWARRSVDLIPTSWLITAAGAVLLGATALFGGLEAAAVDPTPQVEVGETFAGSDLEMTVTGVELTGEGVQLRDDSGDGILYPDEEKRERILVVVVEVVNTFGAPRSAASLSPSSPVVDGIRIDGVEEKGEVLRADDGLRSPMLQPDVPARLLLAWIVGPDEFGDGDEITLTLPDSTHYVGQRLTRGDYWVQVRVGATLSTTIDEVPDR